MSPKFTRNAISNIKSTGTFFPSSRFLANKISRLIPDNVTNVVELGAGNGAVTKSLLAHMSADASLDCYEINAEFIKLLKNNVSDERLTILERSALEIANDFGNDAIDVVVSCLPLALFNDSMKEELMAEIHKSLKPGGLFIQYQYSLKDRKFINKYFAKNTLKFVLRNAPPAFIYLCEK
ncbi:class I SAM-dependent methyltransferase [Kangiella sp. HZ709]|uniref:class I SAM-dependent methyltransferase n=1 Tax=Kangiella sp. HZ709 TaxID=2666328 RepID=UPI0012B02020|nr:methyltransferase domain-containing protein [Kangiella sp. HZ709]MRX27305.1 methyltransferase domain-containing protein [Kangiella sp. HZ709]